MSITTHLVTAEELERDYQGIRCELIDGEVIEMVPPGFEHGSIASNVTFLLRSACTSTSIGRVVGEMGFRLSSSPDNVRAPVAAFVSAARITAWPIVGYFEGGPDLAVEILSPSESAEDVDRKTAGYLDAGTREIWVVSPKAQSVKVYRTDQPVRTLRHHEVLTTPLLPAFSHAVSEFFQ